MSGQVRCTNPSPATCFETFPFPEPTDDQRNAIAAAARELDRLRNNWLNPPEWTRTEVLEFPGSADGSWKRYIDRSAPLFELTKGISHDGRDAADAGSCEMNFALRDHMATVCYPRVVPRDEDCAKQLKKRTLMNLYNERPTWLQLAHRTLDEAVFAACGGDAGRSDDELLGKLLEMNLER